jgi:hypothetical protein
MSMIQDVNVMRAYTKLINKEKTRQTNHPATLLTRYRYQHNRDLKEEAYRQKLLRKTLSDFRVFKSESSRAGSPRGGAGNNNVMAGSPDNRMVGRRDGNSSVGGETGSEVGKLKKQHLGQKIVESSPTSSGGGKLDAKSLESLEVKKQPVPQGQPQGTRPDKKKKKVSIAGARGRAESEPPSSITSYSHISSYDKAFQLKHRSHGRNLLTGGCPATGEVS